jgi:cytoskeletal protein CcmA (bactofilin family)
MSPAPSTLGGARSSGPAFRPGGANVSVIGADLVIQGNLTSKGEVQIEGEVQGDIFGTHIVIGERARVTGGIIAEECVIRGHLLGTVRGRRVLLQSSSHVEGDIYHQTMAIEQGAFFEGKSRRTDDPLQGLTRGDRVPASIAASSEPETSAPPPLPEASGK